MFVFEASSGGHYFPYKVFIHRQEGVHPWLVPVRAAVAPAYDPDLVRLQGIYHQRSYEKKAASPIA